MARIQSRLDRRVFEAVTRKFAIVQTEKTATGLQNLEAVQRVMMSPVLVSVFDTPWKLFFFFGIMIFHPWLECLAMADGGLLIAVALLNQTLTSKPVSNSNRPSKRSTI